jgi:hypothetical protein
MSNPAVKPSRTVMLAMLPFLVCAPVLLWQMALLTWCIADPAVRADMVPHLTTIIMAALAGTAGGPVVGAAGRAAVDYGSRGMTSSSSDRVLAGQALAAKIRANRGD